MRPIRTVMNPESLKMIGIPKSFIDTTIDDFKSNGNPDLVLVKGFVTEYVNRIDYNFSKNYGIYFCGSNGVGKTMLSCIILKEAYRHRYSSRRSTFVEYIDKYTRAWSSKTSDEKSQNEDELYTYYKGVEFLVLEEVGKEIDSKIAAPILEDLLRYREDKGFVTIICTNLDIDTINERYGASVVSLLKGNTTPVTIVSRDERTRRLKKKGGD